MTDLVDRLEIPQVIDELVKGNVPDGFRFERGSFGEVRGDLFKGQKEAIGLMHENNSPNATPYSIVISLDGSHLAFCKNSAQGPIIMRKDLPESSEFLLKPNMSSSKYTSSPIDLKFNPKELDLEYEKIRIRIRYGYSLPADGFVPTELKLIQALYGINLKH